MKNLERTLVLSALDRYVAECVDESKDRTQMQRSRYALMAAVDIAIRSGAIDEAAGDALLARGGLI